jgi:cytochrome c553
VCHGADGVGRSDGTFPRIAGQHASVIVKQIDDIRAGRRGNPIMASHIDTLTDPAEIADVAVYVAGLSPAPEGSGAAHAEPPNDGKHERGAALYRRDCARCHGAAGAGNAEKSIPVVAGQHEAYLLRQLRAIAGSLRRNADPGMVAIFDYRDADLRAVARYLAALPWPAPAAER